MVVLTMGLCLQLRYIITLILPRLPIDVVVVVHYKGCEVLTKVGVA